MCFPRSIPRMQNISRFPRVCVAAKYVMRRSSSWWPGFIRKVYQKNDAVGVALVPTAPNDETDNCVLTLPAACLRYQRGHSAPAFLPSLRERRTDLQLQCE